jgi:5-methylcytosine-specific restriction endonuclease McrA
LNGYNHEYYLRHKVKINKLAAGYRSRNRARLAENARVYNRKRFFWKTAKNLRLRTQGTSATFQELARLWKSQRGVCPYTQRRLTQENSQLDHIVPVIRSGSSTIENLQWVHRDVNYAKRDLSRDEFYRLCADVMREER